MSGNKSNEEKKQSKEEKKAATQTCRSLPAAAKRTVALAIKIPGAAHSSVTKVLEDRELQLAVANELKKAGEKLMKEQAESKGKGISMGASLQKVGAAAQKKLQEPVVKELKKTEEYKKLEKGLAEFKCAFDNTPVGAFVNENKMLLIIVGAVGAIGGGVAMYYTRSGDVPAKAYSLLPFLTPIKLGSVELNASGVKFKPSERQFEATIGAKGEWTGVKANLELSAAFKNDKLVGGGAKAGVSLALNPRTTGFISGSGSWKQGKDNNPDTAKGRADLGVKRKVSKRVNLQMQLYGELDQNDKNRKTQVGVGGKLKVAEPIGSQSSLSLDLSLGTGHYQSRVGSGYGARQNDHRVNVGVTFLFP